MSVGAASIWMNWWQGSLLGRMRLLLGRWGAGSHVVARLPEAELGLMLLFFAWGTQANTAILGLILAAALVLLGLQSLTRRLTWTEVLGAALVYWAVAAIATLASPIPSAALDGLLKLTLYLAGFAVLQQLCQRPRYQTVLVTVVLLGSLLVSVVGIRQHLYGAAELATWTDPESPLASISRAYSSLGNPNLLAGYLIPMLPLGCAAVWTWPGWPRKLLAAVITVMNLACLIYTYSRGGLIGVAAMVLAAVFLIVSSLPRYRRWLMPALVAGIAMAVGLAVASSSTVRRRMLSIFSWRADSSNNFRITVWLTVLTMIGDFFWLGIGPGNAVFNRIYPLYQRPNFNALGAYSVPLELMLETGIIGAVVFAVLLALIMRRGWQQRRQVWVLAALVAVVGMAAHGLVDTVWYRPQVQMLWWLLVAIITASPHQTALTDGAEAISTK